MVVLIHFFPLAKDWKTNLHMDRMNEACPTIQPVPVKRVKPITTISKLLIVLLKVNIVILYIAVIADIFVWVDYSNLAPNVDVNKTFLLSDVLNMIVSLVQTLMTITLGVTFLIWIYRVNKNLHVLSSDPMTFSPGWSVGWYFIPIANFFKPYQAMREIWTVAHGTLPNNNSLLKLWWFLWIMSNYIGRIASKLALGIETPHLQAVSAITYSISDSLSIALNIVALLLVTAITSAYCKNYVSLVDSPNDNPARPVGNYTQNG